MICNCLRWSEAVCFDTSQKDENILVVTSVMVVHGVGAIEIVESGSTFPTFASLRHDL